MLRQLAWAAVLALTTAERVHQAWGRGEVQRFPTSCDQLQTGSYQVPKEGLRLQDCAIAAGTKVQVRLDGPLIVQGNLTVRGTAVFRGPHTLAPFQEACLQVTDGLTVSGFLWVEGCYNDAKDGKGGCLKASSLSMEEGRLELQHCQSKGCGGCAALGSLRQRAGVMSFTQCHAASGGGLDVGDLVQAGGEMAFLVCAAQHGGGGGLRAEKLSTSGAMLFERCESTSGGGAYVNHTLRQGSAGRLQCRNCSASRKGGCLFDYGGVAADGHVEAADVSAPQGSAMHVNGSAAFHTLVVSKADAPAVEVWGLLAAQELTAGPSERALEVKVWKGAMDVKSANCGEVVGCSLKVQAEYQNRTDLVLPRPHCRAGSGVDTSAGEGWVSYGCYKCPVTEFQFQQGAAAKCMPCPADWTCANNALQMRKGWMAPIDPEKLELAELNLTGEGRALQCLNEAACPGGAELPLDPAKPMCSEGRTGVLCAACTAGHYATKGKCEKCQEASQEDKLRLWKIAGCGAAISLGLAGVAWLSRGVVTERWKQADVRWHVLKELAARQAVVLLQVAQLYGVLAALAPDPSTSQGASRDSFWERTYVDVLQLNLAQVQDAFRLQCLWDGDKVRLVSALASPIAPLLMLLACGLLELLKPSGAGMTFKVLTMFFIGGARESAALLRCQLVDKGGSPLGDFAFLQKLPFLLCSETEGVAKWVYQAGYGTAAVYVAVIPFALLYLYMRQRIVLRPSKTITAQAKRGTRSWITKLHPAWAFKKPMQVNDEHLLAAAVAHMTVAFQGKVWLQLQDGKAEMKSPESEGRAAAELTVSSFLDSGDEVAGMLRSRAIMEMLVERCEMEKASKSDRFLSGAKEVFFKYAFCRSVWMEMAQKLLAVGLVTVISTEDGLHLSLAFVLGMAATIAMVQPYIQPQMNELHFFSLLCLAAAAVGFAGAGNPKAELRWLWLSRVSVLLPFLLAAVQALRPDSCEALAVRLFQEARQQLEVLQKGQEVELVVKTVSFI